MLRVRERVLPRPGCLPRLRCRRHPARDASGHDGKAQQLCHGPGSARGFTAPYTLSFIDLPEGPTIFAIIAGGASGGEGLQNGMEMELTIEPISTDANGNEVIGYKFRPARSVNQ